MLGSQTFLWPKKTSQVSSLQILYNSEQYAMPKLCTENYVLKSTQKPDLRTLLNFHSLVAISLLVSRQYISEEIVIYIFPTVN